MIKDTLGQKTYGEVYPELENYPFCSSILYFDDKNFAGKDSKMWNLYLSYNNNRPKRAEMFLEEIDYVLKHKDDKGFYTQLDSKKPYLGFFHLKEKGDKGTLVIAPGGGYMTVCAIDEGFAVGREMASYGYDCYVLKYGIQEKAAFPQMEDDLASLISYLKKEVLLENGYNIMGFSATGHMVGLWGSEKLGYEKYHLPKPKHMSLAYPVITLKQEYSETWTRKTALGKLDLSYEDKLSADQNVDDNYPPVYLTRGYHDETVPVINSDFMEIALSKHHIPHVYRIQECDFHGFGAGDGLSIKGWLKEVDSFFQGKSHF